MCNMVNMVNMVHVVNMVHTMHMMRTSHTLHTFAQKSLYAHFPQMRANDARARMIVCVGYRRNGGTHVR